MKKLLAIAIASISVAAMADDPVGYSPVVGLTELTATTQNTVVPVKFSSLADGTLPIKAKDLVYPRGIPEGTQLYVFVGNTYKAFIMGNDNEWEVLPGASTASGYAAATLDQAAVAGTAIWLVFPRSGDTVTYPTDNGKFYIYGQVINNQTSPILRGTKAAPVSNLLCNPTDAAVTGSVLAEKLASKATNGDTITLLDPTDSTSGNYVFNSTQSAWWRVYVNNGKTTIDKTCGLPTLAKGAGFWYVSKGGESNTEIAW